MNVKITNLKTLLNHLKENKNDGKEVINDLIKIICVLIYGKPLELGDFINKNIDEIIKDLENYILQLEQQDEKAERLKEQNRNTVTKKTIQKKTSNSKRRK